MVFRPRYQIIAECPEASGRYRDLNSGLLVVEQSQSDEIPVLPLKRAYEQHVFSVTQDDV